MKTLPVLNPQTFFHECQITVAVDGVCPVCSHAERAMPPERLKRRDVRVMVVLALVFAAVLIVGPWLAR